MGASNVKPAGKRDRSDADETGNRSFVCHPSGIVMGSTLFRCSFCDKTLKTVIKLRQHYEQIHRSKKIDELTGEPCYLIHRDEINLRSMPVGSAVTTPTPDVIDMIDESHLWLKADQTSILDLTKFTNEPESPVKKSFSKESKASISCGVCKTDRYFACVQSHHGQHICVFCYRFFRKFISNPSILSCPKLGKCSLTMKNKCKACLLDSCLRVYKASTFDPRIEDVLAKYRPINPLENSVRPINERPLNSTMLNGKHDNMRPDELLRDDNANIIPDWSQDALKDW